MFAPGLPCLRQACHVCTGTPLRWQAATNDPYRDSLSCDLLPYNLTNQLLRIINASRTSAATPAALQSAEKTPGLDAFTFDYQAPRAPRVPHAPHTRLPRAPHAQPRPASAH